MKTKETQKPAASKGKTPATANMTRADMISAAKKAREALREKPKVPSVDQLTIARLISIRTNTNISLVSEIIELEQKMTMGYVRRGYKVIKCNYLTIYPSKQPAKEWVSPLNGKNYSISERTTVNVRVGKGFKSYVAGQAMPNNICRFVGEAPYNNSITAPALDPLEAEDAGE